MKMGLNLLTQFAIDSVRFVSSSMYETLSEEHELVCLPHEYPYMDEVSRNRMADRFVETCDLITGTLNPALLAARHRTGSSVPFVPLILGALPRGAYSLRQQVPYLTTADVLIVNCTSEVALARKFFRNANVQVVPFAYDERTFFRLDAAEITALRTRLGFAPDDRILLYGGRITSEKNVHTVLRVFRALLETFSDAHLVLVGPISGGGGFMEFGVAALDYANTISRTISALGIPRDHVHLPGHVNGTGMREWYNAADVVINLTLHHDENFGMAQVEAMACGVPVVGSAWGGLKDTIVDGVTGYHISAVPTETGMKVDWWEALNRVIELLQDPHCRRKFGERGIRHVTENFSRERFKARLARVFAGAVAGRTYAAEQLQVTEFGAKYWSVCDPRSGAGAPYRRGPDSYSFYRELVTPFAGQTDYHVPESAPLAPDDILVLASPLVAASEVRFRVDSPLFPFEVEVPAAYVQAFRSLLAIFEREPVVLADRISGDVMAVRQALSWMIGVGLLLRSRLKNDGVQSAMPHQMGTPLLSVRKIDRREVDLLLY